MAIPIIAVVGFITNIAHADSVNLIVNPVIDVYVNTQGGHVHYGEASRSNIQTFKNSTDKTIYVDNVSLVPGNDSSGVSIGTWTAVASLKDGSSIKIFEGTLETKVHQAEYKIELDPGESFDITWTTSTDSKDLLSLVEKSIETIPVKVSYETHKSEFKGLTFTALSDNSKISWSSSMQIKPDIWYSVDGTQFTKWDPNVNVMLSTNQKIYVHGTNPNGLSRKNENTQFIIQENSSFNASGNINSLLDGNDGSLWAQISENPSDTKFFECLTQIGNNAVEEMFLGTSDGNWTTDPIANHTYYYKTNNNEAISQDLLESLDNNAMAETDFTTKKADVKKVECKNDEMADKKISGADVSKAETSESAKAEEAKLQPQEQTDVPTKDNSGSGATKPAQSVPAANPTPSAVPVVAASTCAKVATSTAVCAQASLAS